MFKHRKGTIKKVSKVSKSLKIPTRTLKRRMKVLRLNAYHQRRVPFLTQDHIKKRLYFCRHMRQNRRKLYNNLPIMFSDEKKFTVDGGFNRQNTIIYASSRQEADENGGLHGTMKYPLSVMIWVGLTVNGPTKPYIIEDKQRINREYYKNRILPFAKREGRRLLGTDKWVYQQDGATCHTYHKSMDYINKKFT